MSIKAMAWAYAQRTGSPVRKAVLTAIADVADDNGEAYPAIDTIATMIEVSRSTVQRAVKELEATGFLDVQRDRRRDSGGVTSNLYRLRFEGQQLSLLTVAQVNLTPLPKAGSQIDTGGVSQLRHGGGVNGDTPYEQPLEQSVEVKTLRVPVDAGHGFTRFWEAWPKSPRKVAKQTCWMKWQARGLGAEVEAIVAHVEAMKRSRQWREGFEPAPLTYLNQRRWMDELPPDDGGAKRRPLAALSDNELLARAQAVGLKGSGLTRFELVSKIQEREARP